MNCLACGHKNPATVGYCQRCGGRMNLTADEIAVALVQKKKGEEVQRIEYYARQSLVFSGVLFLLALTFMGMSAGAPEETGLMPSVSGGARYLEVDGRRDRMGELQKIEIPVEPFGKKK